MKAILFAGADAMTDLAATKRAIQVPHVQYLLSKYGLLKNIETILSNLVRDPFPALTASMLTQIGLFNSYVHRFGRPDYFVGCSLGDLAKLICAGMVPIDAAIEGLELFSEALADVPPGAIVQLRTNDPITADFCKQLTESGLHLAMRQTSHHCLVAGTNENLRNWKVPAGKLRPLFPYPLHSPLMKNAYLHLVHVLEMTPFMKGTGQIISSIEARELNSTEEIRVDLRNNILGTVKWSETFQWLAKQKSIQQCISVGPITTLQHFAERIEAARTLPVLDVVQMVERRMEEVCIA